MKTFNKEWQDYKKKKLPENLNPHLVHHIKIAYYAGAVACLEVAMQESETFEDFQKIMKTLTDELGSLATQIMAKRSTIH